MAQFMGYATTHQHKAIKHLLITTKTWIINKFYHYITSSHKELLLQTYQHFPQNDAQVSNVTHNDIIQQGLQDHSIICQAH